MLKIGSLELSSPLVLAPLAGVSDLPFRLINRRFGCELAFVEMTSTHALTRRNPRTLRMLETVAEDRPLGLQLLGNEIDSLKAALEVLGERGYSVIDLNAACPVRKVVRRGEGAALMQEPRRLKGLLKVLVEGAMAPVTVKIRAGWDAGSVNAKEVALHAREAGISALFIHGRTKTQGYRGAVDYRVIEEVKRAVDIPVIASGDVLDAALAKRMFEETGCDGVVVARGGLGNPWIFRATRALLETGAIPPRPSMEEIAAVATEHMDLCMAHYGEERGAKIFRKFLIWYTRGISGMRHLRAEVGRMTCREEMAGLIGQMRRHEGASSRP